MVIDGVSGALKNDTQSVEIAVTARLVNHEPEGIAAEIDLRNGDGMCMGYHGWIDGDYGEVPIVAAKSES